MPPRVLRDPIDDRPRFGRNRRLRRPAEYSEVLATPRARSLRAARLWLSMTAAWGERESGRVRFGVTVGRRQARRAVDRALVKRIVREAGRHAAPALERWCTEHALGLDIAFRLKTAAPARADSATALSQAQWRRALRVEAEDLLDRLARHLRQQPLA